MSLFEENTIKIADYLENKMSSSEEEAFMKELEIDETLRQQYEDELLISTLLENENKQTEAGNNLLFQSADDHINIIENALEKKGYEKKEAGVIKFLRDYKNIAAAAVIIIISIVFFLIKREDKSQLVTARKDSLRHTRLAMPNPKVPLEKNSPVPDSTGLSRKQLPEKMLAENLYKKWYISYSANENDPVEISEYYDSYKNGNFAKVLAADKTDYQLMGGGDRNKLLESYMKFYKGLAFLAEKKPKEAIQKFDEVLQSASKNEPQYYDAQWYIALAYIKNNELNKADSMAKEIMNSSSNYKVKAAQLFNELKAK